MELRRLLEGGALGVDPAAQYAVLDGEDDFAVLRSRIDLVALETALRYAQQVRTMSPASKRMLVAAQLLHCLRRAVKHKAWEPVQQFPLGSCDTDEILDAVISGSSIGCEDPDAVHNTVCSYVAAWANDRADREQLLRKIEYAAATTATATAATTEDGQVVTVMDAFQFYNAANYAEEIAKLSCFAREFELLRRLSLDRTSRLLLYATRLIKYFPLSCDNSTFDDILE